MKVPVTARVGRARLNLGVRNRNERVGASASKRCLWSLIPANPICAAGLALV